MSYYYYFRRLRKIQNNYVCIIVYNVGIVYKIYYEIIHFLFTDSESFFFLHTYYYLIIKEPLIQSYFLYIKI